MITKNMKLLDIVSEYPEMENIFHEYDKVIGKCLLCSNLFDSIEDIAIIYNLEINKMLKKLNNLSTVD